MVEDLVHMKTYKALDLVIEEEQDTEYRCKCQLCGKNKFYVNKETGIFDCKTCGASGNRYTFMNLVYTKHLNATTSKHYNTLSKDRGGIPGDAFEKHQLAYNNNSKEWWIPIINKAGSITNIRIWNKNTGILKNLAGCKVSPFNESVIADYDHIILCEGEWDAIAMDWLQDQVGGDYPCAVVAMPGAMVFKEVWAPMFNGKHVTLMYDNDNAGLAGAKRTIKILEKFSKAREIDMLNWPEGMDDKYDIRDFIKDNMRDLGDTYNRIWNMVGKPVLPNEAKFKDAFTRTTFESVIKDYESMICVNQDVRNTLLLLFSIIFSNKLKDVPLWMFIVGPAGGGKSMSLGTVADAPQTYFLSNLGPKTLVSGFDIKGYDPSLLPKIIGKTIILKEFTEVLGLPIGDQDQIFDVLRGAYDGRVDRVYANGVTRTYPVPGSGHDTCHFSFVAGVTNVIHGRNRASLGERFLKYQMFENHEDSTDIIKASISNILSSTVPETDLKKSATAFIEYKWNNFYIPEVPKWVQQRITALAQIVGSIRAHIERTSSKDLVYRPVAEVGSRLAKQLIKLNQMVAFTLGKHEVDEEVYNLSKRVSLDTSYGWNRDAILEIAQSPGGITKSLLAERAKMSLPRAELCLEDLCELHNIQWTRQTFGAQGAPPKVYTLSDKMRILFEEADILGGDVVATLPEIPGEFRRMVNDERRKAPIAKVTPFR